MSSNPISVNIATDRLCPDHCCRLIYVRTPVKGTNQFPIHAANIEIEIAIFQTIRL